MPEEFAGSGTQYDQYVKDHPQGPPGGDSGDGGLFGESVGAKVARGLLYVVPIAGQIVAGHERNVAHQRAQVNTMILNAALKGGDPALLQTDEVQKAAKSIFGKSGDTFLGVAHHVLQHKLDVHNGWVGLMLKHGYGQAGSNPVEVMRNAANEATQSGIPIPQEAQSLIAQHVMAPEIAKAKEEAARPGKVETQREKTQATIDVKTDPTNVGATAAAGAYVAGEKTTATEEARKPYVADRAAAQEERVKGREARGEQRQITKEGRAATQQVTAEDRKVISAAEAAKMEALDAGGHKVEIVPDQTTRGDLRNLIANGGKVRTTSSLLENLGITHRPAESVPHVAAPHTDPVNDYLKRWNH